MHQNSGSEKSREVWKTWYLWPVSTINVCLCTGKNHLVALLMIACCSVKMMMNSSNALKTYKTQLTEQDVGRDVFNYLGIELTVEGTKVAKKTFEKTG